MPSYFLSFVMVPNKTMTLKICYFNPIWPKPNMVAKIAINSIKIAFNTCYLCKVSFYICFQGQTFQILGENAWLMQNRMKYMPLIDLRPQEPPRLHTVPLKHGPSLKNSKISLFCFLWLSKYNIIDISRYFLSCLIIPNKTRY